MTADARAAVPVSLPELFWIGLRIGATSFGGFMALISVLQQVFVEKRRLLDHQEMLDGVSLATLLPGPIAVNVAALVGYRLHGVPGAAVHLCAVLLPSFVMVVILADFYFRFGALPAADRIFAGFVPAVTAIILAAVWNLGRRTLRSRTEFALAAAAAALLLLSGGFFVTLAIVAGAAGLGWLAFRRPAAPLARGAPAPRIGRGTLLAFAGLGGLALLFLFPPPGLDPNSNAQLLITFSGVSLLLFGGGFVFIPLMQELVVAGMHWVTPDEFAAGIALGQITPGPILLSAAFIGYKVQGLGGAVAATLGIFAPAAILMIAATRIMDRIKSSRAVQASLRGIRAAVVGMILAAAATIGQTIAPHWLSAAILGAALLALLRFRVDAVWIIPAAGLLGLLCY